MSGVSQVLDDVRSIGVLTASGIGDFLMTVPALTALRTAYPAARIVVLGDSWHSGFLPGRIGPWDDAVAVPREDGICRLAQSGGAPIHDFIAQHQSRYDLVLQMHGGGGDSNAVVRALRPRFSVGSWAPGAARLDRWVPYVPGRPEILRWLEVAELAGAEPMLTTGSLIPRVHVQPTDLTQSQAVWAAGGTTVLLHVGARDGRRCWSPANFAAVARELHATLNAQILVVGSARDSPASAEVTGLLGREGAVDLTGRLSLAATLGLARRSALFVGNDSGPRHLAAAAGTPTVGIFWVANAMAFGPLVGGSSRAAISFTVDCPVCGQTQLRSRCEHDVSFVDSVTPEDVLEQCHRAIECDGRTPTRSVPARTAWDPCP